MSLTDTVPPRRHVSAAGTAAQSQSGATQKDTGHFRKIKTFFLVKQPPRCHLDLPERSL